MIMNYSKYLKESVEQEFKIGDTVFINGEVDDEEFDNASDVIGDISKDRVTTNMNENGRCKPYTYTGIVYHCVEHDWWVSPYNLKKTDHISKREFSERDPYGEEHWEVEEEVTEAKKADTKLVTLTGQDFMGNNDQNISYLMQHNMTPENRKIIEDLINRNAAGKKVLFINRKYNEQGREINQRKERIIKGAYWKENPDKPNLWRRWELYLIGTKKDYLVNTSREMGYYTDVFRQISDLDPYGEELWD